MQTIRSSVSWDLRSYRMGTYHRSRRHVEPGIRLAQILLLSLCGLYAGIVAEGCLVCDEVAGSSGDGASRFEILVSGVVHLLRAT